MSAPTYFTYSNIHVLKFMECQEFILRQISIRFVGVYCYITRLYGFMKQISISERVYLKFRQYIYIYNYCVGDMITGRVGVFYRSMFNNNNHIIIIRGFQRFLSVFNYNKNF